ncbi:MAG TPA: patatin-like phospholipase family protein [Roseiarcus sp.]|nr:patatin-like phospholipase family protein [Roseiarcus sp.]
MTLTLFRNSHSEQAAVEPARRGAKPRIGFVLGAGVARGWAHIGALRELVEMGITPDIVVGASVGAVVGGCYAAGRLDALEDFARSLTKRSVFNLIDVSFRGGGLMGGHKLRARLESSMGQQRIENLPLRFVAVATEMRTGHEVWLKSGPIVNAMRASYALPGIFEPVKIGGRWLIDGAIVNPVPVNVARAFGADWVLALAVGGDGQNGATHLETADEEEEPPAPEEPRAGKLWWLRRGAGRAEGSPPNVASVMVDTFNITQDRIMRSRLAGDPPDHMLTVKTKSIGLFEFHRAAELIELGRATVRKAAPELLEQLKDALTP